MASKDKAAKEDCRVNKADGGNKVKVNKDRDSRVKANKDKEAGDSRVKANKGKEAGVSKAKGSKVVGVSSKVVTKAVGDLKISITNHLK